MTIKKTTKTQGEKEQRNYKNRQKAVNKMANMHLPINN